MSERTLRRDLHELRTLGFELGYLDGYQLQEGFDLGLELNEAAVPRSQSLPVVFEQQLKLLRSSYPGPVADTIQATVEAAAPAALAELFSKAIQQTKAVI